MKGNSLDNVSISSTAELVLMGVVVVVMVPAASIKKKYCTISRTGIEPELGDISWPFLCLL